MNSTKLLILTLLVTNCAFANPSAKNLRAMRLKSLKEKHEEFQKEIVNLKREVNQKASFVDEEVEELKEMIFMQEEMILELTEKLRDLKSK
ncbi:MAG: hypothetical protein SNF33_03210 [Candidatus Algichlamydia australiensis]|nr:hypothetical protein [Chlamydiales bacterium]